MHEIKIEWMRLENFKCHSHLDLAFGGRSVSIYGDNAAGKTSVYDALTWLLFGKDSRGNGEKNMEIKPLAADGSVRDHNAITSVEACLVVDGVPSTLRRSFREKWSTRRGSSELIYDGNVSDYSIDGVPLKKNNFDSRVAEIVPEEVFRLLTSVTYFPEQMKWQDRRNVLFDMSGAMTDPMIMHQDPRFEPLLEGMGALDLDDYRAKLGSERRGFIGTRDDTPARLSELQRTLDSLMGEDFDALMAARGDLAKALEDVKTEILAIDNDSAVSMLQMKARNIDQDIRELDMANEAYRREHDDKSEIWRLENVIADHKQARRRLANELDTIRRDGEAAERFNTQAEAQMAKAQKHHDDYMARLRDQWSELNDQAFTGAKCPTCGQDLPADQLMEAMEKFEEDKKYRLAQIESQADAAKRHMEEQASCCRLRALPTPEQIQEIEDAIKKEDAAIDQATEELRKAKEAKAEPKDMDKYAITRDGLLDQKQAVRKQLDKMLAGSKEHRADLVKKAEAIQEEIYEKDGVLAREDLRSVTQKRIDQLKEEQANAAAGLEAIEQMLFLIEEFTRYKASFVEESINKLFSLARFRLFRNQANGGLEERCDVTFNGVPYGSLNNGMRINVGVDIINALSLHHGVRVPLFIDNAESVTRLENCASQTIRLVVSEKDKELIVK